MTLGTLFLMVVTVYLVLIAYGVSGMDRRRMVGRPKRVTQALLVLAPPGLIALLLVISDERGLVVAWRWFLLAMPVVGTVVALLTDVIAQRTRS